MSSCPRDPATAAEWQEAVDLAHLCLRVDGAKLYGLVDVARCVNVLRSGAERSMTPRSDSELLSARPRTPALLGEAP